MTSPKDASLSVTNKVAPNKLGVQIWLASGSPRRAALLQQLGYVLAKQIAPEIDETPLVIKRRAERPREYVRRLAAAKAAALGEIENNVCVIAADTAVAVGRRLLEKTEDETRAREHLKLLSGRGHRVYSGVCVAYKGECLVRVAQSRVSIKNLSAGEINDYIASEEWRGCAGAYAIQGRAGAFVQKLVGSYSNVVGLPLYETANLLRGLGINPQL